MLHFSVCFEGVIILCHFSFTTPLLHPHDVIVLQQRVLCMVLCRTYMVYDSRYTSHGICYMFYMTYDVWCMSYSIYYALYHIDYGVYSSYVIRYVVTSMYCLYTHIRYVMPYYTTPYYSILCYTMLCYAMLYYTICNTECIVFVWHDT